MLLRMTGLALALALALPVPGRGARELSTDRPDTTESPYTVERGRIQVELEALSWTRAQRSTPGSRGDQWAFGAFNVKAGLSPAADLQVAWTPWQRGRTEDLGSGAVTEDEGSSDLMLRLKRNLWGDDGGPTAMALLPFISLPTSKGSAGRSPTGGLILPLNIELPQGFSLAVEAEVDVVKDDEADPAHLDSLASASLSHSLWPEKVDAFLEAVSSVGEGASSAWRPFWDAGLVFPLGPDTQADLGVNVGAAPAADDLRAFVGYSFRI